MKRILTYGTFDLLHWGHIRLLKRAKALGDYLIVGLSTDDFNESKPGKQPSYHPYEVRQMMLEAIRYVDLVIPEATWEQKRADVIEHEVDIVVMGSDWQDSPRFEYLRDLCDVAYLPRTEGTSTSQIRRDLLFEAIQYTREDASNPPSSAASPASNGLGHSASSHHSAGPGHSPQAAQNSSDQQHWDQHTAGDRHKPRTAQMPALGDQSRRGSPPPAQDSGT